MNLCQFFRSAGLLVAGLLLGQPVLAQTDLTPTEQEQVRNALPTPAARAAARAELERRYPTPASRAAALEAVRAGRDPDAPAPAPKAPAADPSPTGQPKKTLLRRATDDAQFLPIERNGERGLRQRPTGLPRPVIRTLLDAYPGQTAEDVIRWESPTGRVTWETTVGGKRLRFAEDGQLLPAPGK